jgi:K+-transporting ATPase KdpC subunit
MQRFLRPALIVLLAFTAITGILYPLAVTGIAQLLFPTQANGSVLSRNDTLVGSSLIGQQFTSPQYFWERLSATSPMPYNSGASSGSNLGPLNVALKENARARIEILRQADPNNTQPIPVDLVTASASGLDPHVSVAAALYQVPRVAKARRYSEQAVRSLVGRLTESRDLGFLGEPRVNVLLLNLALDQQAIPPGRNQ